ncbi:MAG: T9SS type A sorting domain-containing protein, partial [Bacteroidota bacterium]
SADCIDCHMSYTGKSAIGVQTGNGWKGDIRSHVMAINTNNINKTAGMFTADGKALLLDANGLAAATLDFACLSCHTDKDLAWASTYAKNIHNGITDVEPIQNIPTNYALAQNYPNPFNPTTTINFSLPKTSNVKLEIYSITGELVASLINNIMPAGNHKVTLDASRFASGVYIYRINADQFTQSKKMILMK